LQACESCTRVALSQDPHQNLDLTQ